MSDKPAFKIWSTLGLHDLGSFLAVPNFFIDKLMPLGGDIPVAFWKFLFVVWRDVIAPSTKNEDGSYAHRYRCKKTVKQWQNIYHVPKLAAMDATIACSVSGLFTVDFGWRDVKDKPGAPTTLHYRQRSTEQDWIAFIKGLSNAYQEFKSEKMSRRGMVVVEDREADNSLLNYEQEMSAVYSWELQAALAIDRARAQLKLPPANSKKIEWLINHGVGKREADGNVIVYGRKSNHEIRKLRARRSSEFGSLETGRGDLFKK